MLKPVLAVLAILAVAPSVLRADTYSFAIRTAAANMDPATQFVASGTITGPADPFAANAFDIASITGSANGYNFLGVVNPGTTNSHAPGTVGSFTFDNVLFTANGAPHTDSFGFLLYLNSPVGTSLAHVYYTGITTANPSGYAVEVVDPNDPGAITPFAIDSFNITPTAVPEPSTLVLLGTGVAGLASLVRRRFKR